jgi:cytochrome d ubiquinol oxidase subunit I
MVGMGLLMLATGIIAIYLVIRKSLFQSKIFFRWCIMLSPIGIIAILCGWITTEVGRQPYVVYGVLRTVDAHSPIITEQVLISIITFLVVYTFVFGIGIYYIFKLINKGPKIGEWIEIYGRHGLRHPITLADIFPLSHNERD